MRKPEEWGGYIELVALARALKRPIVFLTPGNEYDEIIWEDHRETNGPPIFVDYNGRDHYQGLVIPEGKDPSDILEEVKAAIQNRKQAAPNTTLH